MLMGGSLVLCDARQASPGSVGYDARSQRRCQPALRPPAVRQSPLSIGKILDEIAGPATGRSFALRVKCLGALPDVASAMIVQSNVGQQAKLKH
jgi:hypothetical protein